MIVVTVVGTATNTDLLANTDMANVPADGILEIFAAATQNDHTLTVTGPGAEPVIRSSKIQLRSNGMVSLKDDIPMVIPVFQGGHYIVNHTVVTAGTFGYVFIFTPIDEL